MVQRGQFLERPTVIPSGSGVLEAMWHRGERTPACLILPPSPERGGMDHVLATELVWALSRAGHATLRFNYRGVGASSGPRSAPATELADAAAALELLRENTAEPEAVAIALPGSSPTALALAARKPRLVGVGLIHPEPTSTSELSGLKTSVWILVPALEPTGWRASAEAAGARWVSVPGADRSFQRGLPEVGRLAVAWVDALGDITSDITS